MKYQYIKRYLLMDSSEIQIYSFGQNDQIILTQMGARIVKLVLSGITVVESQEPIDTTGSGNFLMYPWVNRIQVPQPPYQPNMTDGNGLPIHGIVVNAPMQLSDVRSQQSIVITAKPNPLTKQLPGFIQIFTLTAGKLDIQLKVIGQSSLPLCFGYHPYIQIDQASLSSLIIQTNIKRNIKLDQKSLLPSDIKINSSSKYDHLFKTSEQGEAFFRLKHELSGKSVEIRSSDMKFWQVYTPPDGKRIAVEPMTFMGNIYKIYNQQEYGVLPMQAKFTILAL